MSIKYIIPNILRTSSIVPVNLAYTFLKDITFIFCLDWTY